MTELAPTRRSTPGSQGGFVPGRLAGYTHDGEAYCPECADDIHIANPDGVGDTRMSEYPAFETDPNGFGVGVLSGFSEADAPGLSCGVCLRRLQTNIIHYDDQ